MIKIHQDTFLNKIKNCFKIFYSVKVRRYEFTDESLVAFSDLRKKSRDLLLDMVSRVKPGLDVEDLIITGNYKDFGFKHKQAFYRSRNELVDAGFIVYEGQDHYVNLNMFGYNTRRQVDSFLSKFKIKKEQSVNMGQFDR